MFGMVARYHLLHNGRRQYLSFHIAGDMPDAQALFIDRWIMPYVRWPGIGTASWRLKKVANCRRAAI
jgi:hypothetical protein